MTVSVIMPGNGYFVRCPYCREKAFELQPDFFSGSEVQVFSDCPNEECRVVKFSTPLHQLEQDEHAH